VFRRRAYSYHGTGHFFEEPMPFTAKLSRRFYDHFGDELTNEFVDLINSMDTTYKSELREMNELSFARFDAKLELRVAELRTEIVAMGSEIRSEMHAQKADLIKWMFLFFTGSALANVLLR
jgi:hypothetical protein